MTEVLIANAGTYRFDGDALPDAAARRWPSLQRYPSPGPADGHLQHLDDARGALTVALLPDGEGLRVEAAPERIAELMTWLAEQPGFPDDGTVLVYDWAPDVMPLRRGARADELLAQLQG